MTERRDGGPARLSENGRRTVVAKFTTSTRSTDLYAATSNEALAAAARLLSLPDGPTWDEVRARSLP